MTAKTTNNKHSAKKKLIPAVGMLLASAMALTSSTYAWFTMSREVSVENIQMTATVPEDLQISLGRLAKADAPGTAETLENGVSLVKGTGTLYAASGSTADNLGASAPEKSWDWSNSADISAYYSFGKLMPASSTTGETIYYTPDAIGVGRDVSGIAKYYAANSALDAFKTGGTAVPESGEDSAKATLHAATSKNSATINDGWKDQTGTSKYTVAAAWNDTNDDGYYVDIPIWIRSSGSEDVNLRVDGYVLPGTADDTNGKKETDFELYRAVRVAILNGVAGDNGIYDSTGKKYATTTAGSAVVSGANILPLVDAWDKATSTVKSGTGADALYTDYKTKNSPYALASGDTKGILDSDIYVARASKDADTLWGVSSLGKYDETAVAADLSGYINTTESVVGNYTEITPYTVNTAIATIKCPANSGSTYSSTKYGEPKKLVIRVWLDGEDDECWNDNAGQDWAISLKFSKVK